MSIFDKYRTYLEDHFSREDHNDHKVATKYLTVKTTGTFDYVSIKWTIHADKLAADYPKVKLKQWSLCGIRRFGDFTKLDAFPEVTDGEVFLNTPQPEGKHNEYLKPDAPANYAFFLVAKYLWSSRKTILGPLTVSLTPLRAGTKETWKEIAEILNTSAAPASKPQSPLMNKKALLAEFTEGVKEIENRTDLTQDQKETLIERTWLLYDIYGKDER